MLAGGNVWSDQLVEWCGDEQPQPVTSSGRTVLLHFRTDNRSNKKRGFKVNYYAISGQLLSYSLTKITGHADNKKSLRNIARFHQADVL